MKLLTTLPKIVDKKAKRLGRGHGTGKGGKSGRGTTRHQAARQDIPLHFEGGQGRMVKKYPLLRGKKRNKSIKTPALAISLSQLNIFKDGDTVTHALLVERGIVRSERPAKVLGSGKLERKLTVALPVSAKARTFIEKAGGAVTSS